MQRFKTKSMIINIIIIAVLAVSMLTGGILIGTKYNTTNEMSNEPAKAALDYASSSAKTQSTNSCGVQYLNIHIYYDSAIYTSVRVSSNTINSTGGSLANFTWTGNFSVSLRSGYSWTDTRKQVTYGTSRDKSSAEEAQTTAYEDANSANADTASVSVSGTSITLKSISVSGCGLSGSSPDYAAIVVIFQTWYTVTGSIENPDTSIATVSPNSFTYLANATSAKYIRYEGKGDYDIASIKINGTSITINASNPGSYTTMTGCEYRCYRSDKYVYVHVQKVTTNLNMVATYGILRNITASISNTDTSKATLDKTSETYLANSGAQLTFTYTGKTNYYINTIKINGNNITISETAPASFSSTTGTQYKCYRDASKVIVIVTNLTQNSTIVGTYATLWSATSNKPSLIIQEDETTQSFSNYFTNTHNAYALVVAQFSRNQNIYMCLDGVWIKLYGLNSSGSATGNNGKVNYAHNIYNNYVYIELTNLPNGAHSVILDHYVSSGASIQTSTNGGSADIAISQIDTNTQQVVVRPDGDNFWVQTLQMDGIEVPITYYKAEIYGVGGARTIEYVAKESTNTFMLYIEGIYESINIVFNLVNVQPDYKVPPTSGGASVTGTVVTASVGGEARIVGNDIANGQSTDTVTVMAVAYTGYEFKGWAYADNESEILSNSTSVVFTKAQVDGKVIKALFTPKTSATGSPNGQTNNTDEIV